MKKEDLLKDTINQVDFTAFDASSIITAMQGMSFSSRETGRAADILKMMIEDPDCTVILTLAGSSSAAGCQRIYADLVKLGFVDVVVATGASIVDMDFFEALGFQHYRGSAAVDDRLLRERGAGGGEEKGNADEETGDPSEAARCGQGALR